MSGPGSEQIRRVNSILVSTKSQGNEHNRDADMETSSTSVYGSRVLGNLGIIKILGVPVISSNGITMIDYPGDGVMMDYINVSHKVRKTIFWVSNQV